LYVYVYLILQSIMSMIADFITVDTQQAKRILDRNT
jgi:hypothetical protein